MSKSHSSYEADLRHIAEDYYDDVLAYCRRHTNSLYDAQDLTQETFLHFARSYSRYTNKGKPLALLLTIARNLCIDRARRERYQPTTLDDAVEDTNSKSPFSSTNTYLDVRAALKELPADLREVVELRYGQDLAIKDVAQVLGISRFAVRRKINAALAQLEELLGPVYGKSIRRTAQNNKETMHL